MKKQKNFLQPRISAAQTENIVTAQEYLDLLTLIALSRFEWVDLPSSMDERMLEWYLFMYGCAALLKDEKLGFINTKAAYAGNFNIYGLPTEINCYAFGQFNSVRKVYSGLLKDANNKVINDENQEAILVLNNSIRTNTYNQLCSYAVRIAEVQRSADVNIKNQKYPYFILTNDNQLLSMKNIFKQIDGNEPVIFASKKALEINDIRTINTGAPYVADKLMDYKRKIINEALTYLGIQVIDEKKERLIESETSQNNEVTNLLLQSALIQRQKAAAEFNEKYGKNISVRVRSDLNNIIKTQLSSVAEWDDKDNDNVIDKGEING